MCTKSNIDDSLTEQAIEDYLTDSSLTVSKICKKYSISTKRLYNYIRKNNIEVRKKKTNDTLQKIIEEYTSDTNVSLLSLSEKYNVTYATISRWLKEAGVEVRLMPTNRNDIAISEAIKLYKSGLNADDSARSVGISRNTLKVYLRDLNILRKNDVYQKDITYDASFFDKIDTEEKAYWLGFIFADGSVYKSKLREHGGKLTIELSVKDRDHLEKFKESLKCNINIKSRFRSCHLSNNPEKREMVSISIASSEIIEDLMKYGCIPNKTYDRYIAKFTDDKKLKAAFLRGYIDGDGHIRSKITNYTIAISVHNVEIKNSLKELIYDVCGKYPHEEERIASNYHQYNLYFRRKDDFFNFANKIYEDATIYMNRKYEKYLAKVQKQQAVHNQHP